MPCRTFLFESVCSPWPNSVVVVLFYFIYFFSDTNLALQTLAEVPCEGIMSHLFHFFYKVKFHLKLSKKGTIRKMTTISRVKVKNILRVLEQLHPSKILKTKTMVNDFVFVIKDFPGKLTWEIMKDAIKSCCILRPSKILLLCSYQIDVINVRGLRRRFVCLFWEKRVEAILSYHERSFLVEHVIFSKDKMLRCMP